MGIPSHLLWAGLGVIIASCAKSLNPPTTPEVVETPPSREDVPTPCNQAVCPEGDSMNEKFASLVKEYIELHSGKKEFTEREEKIIRRIVADGIITDGEFTPHFNCDKSWIPTFSGWSPHYSFCIPTRYWSEITASSEKGHYDGITIFDMQRAVNKLKGELQSLHCRPN